MGRAVLFKFIGSWKLGHRSIRSLPHLSRRSGARRAAYRVAPPGPVPRMWGHSRASRTPYIMCVPCHPGARDGQIAQSKNSSAWADVQADITVPGRRPFPCPIGRTDQSEAVGTAAIMNNPLQP